MAVIAKVAVQAAPYAIDKVYDYLLPQDMAAQVGCRVLVPFGRGNRSSEALILSLGVGVPDKPLKTVRSLLDEESVVSDKEIRLALWMRQRYFCTFYDALHTILPAAVWYRYRELWRMADGVLPEGLPEKEAAVCRLLEDGPMETDTLKQALGDDVAQLLRRMEKAGKLRRETESRRKVRDKVDLFVKLAVPADQALEMVGKTARRQREVVAFLAQNGETGLHDLCYFTGAARKTVEVLAQTGTVCLREQETYRITEKQYTVKAIPITLNDEQQQVYEDVLRQVQSGKAGVTLLQGVTGSGKTLVYIRLAQELLRQGRSVMILVPEIALTPQMMARFTAYFGDEVALLHSGLRMTERYDQFKRIRRGEARIVLGTRSAVFAPLGNIGLIVMDEEQESTYKSESTPRYHARDIAKFRVNYNRAYCLLCSATPSVESYYMAQSGKYRYHALHHRYGDAVVPTVQLVDMNNEDLYRGKPMISMALARAVSENIRAGRQSILLLNRRGYHTYAVCKDCKTVAACPNCSISMTYHAANNRLMCHYCGHSEPAYVRCKACGGELTFSGGGTQKAEDQLREAFPEARILRVDTDTTANKYALEKKLNAFVNGEYDIMIGTQMVAKGLDFENVTLVGVLSADQSLYSDDYRSNERTFDLLTQVVGRAGRGRYRGMALIQTHVPENPYLHLAAAQAYESFFETEIRFRRAMLYPPFADLLQIGFVGEKEDTVRAAAEHFSALLAETFRRDYPNLPLRLLRASAASVSRMGGKYRYKIIMKYKNSKAFRDAIAMLLSAFSSDKRFLSVTAYADPNPDAIL